MEKIKGRFNFICQAVILAVVVLGIIFALVSGSSITRASVGIMMPQSIVGEYSRDGETWMPLDHEAELSAAEGDLYLRGKFSEITYEKNRVYYYNNHIGVRLSVDGQPYYVDSVYEFSEIMDTLPATICDEGWDYWYFEEGLPEDSLVEIHLKNVHKHGNENAYREFLDTMNTSPDTDYILKENIKQYGLPFRIAGIVFMIAGIMMLGAFVAGVSLHMKGIGTIGRTGFLALFTGIFVFMDTIDLSLVSEIYVLNTYGKYVSLILAVFWLTLSFINQMKTPAQKIAKAFLGFSAAADMLLLGAAFTGQMLIYDGIFFWEYIQIVIIIGIILCGIRELRSAEKSEIGMTIVYILAHGAILIDMAGINYDLHYGSIYTKTMLMLVLIVLLMRGAKKIILDHQASIRAEALEKELEESRISIMLSQIQPHFMYNVLGTIRGLCRENPEKAWSAIGDFSGYLRGNMTALTNSRYIHFASELRHIEAYLRLEKMRMGDKLNVVYDVRETDFFLPPLTVQPLVENAVKHGLFDKEEAGTITIHTSCEDDIINITVEDDGIGFDVSAPVSDSTKEHHEHIGIQNVRSRLEKMTGGTMIIESVPGKGTKAVITMKKDGRKGN